MYKGELFLIVYITLKIKFQKSRTLVGIYLPELALLTSYIETQAHTVFLHTYFLGFRQSC